MKIKRSHLFVGLIGLTVVGYFVIRGAMGGGSEAKATPVAKADELQSVRITPVAEALRPYGVVLRGRTEATRTVVVRAETAGAVAATPTPEGSFVRKGQVLCRLDVDARGASLAQAEATLRSEELQYQSAQALKERGFRSETQVLAAKAELDQAKAQLEQARIILDQVNIRAPFSGVFDNREAEVGSYLAPGQACGTLIELSPLLVVGDASEADAARLTVGSPATARLATGGSLSGRVRYVSREAHPQTRTYRVEVVVPNPGAAVRSGLSAELDVRAGQGAAHLVPVSALVLDAAGRQGVRYVAGADTVAFTPVKVLEETPQGVWVSGLSGPVKVITVGQSYVSEGQKVRVAAR
ncbi:MAG TPA: efflux RND transporter periplasmic adaptor subunit [Caulobacteraceae bacterium]|nr:efflux RND transporter periplasmic adaptor subunit [Caulobacteraceae bacterium]